MIRHRFLATSLNLEVYMGTSYFAKNLPEPQFFNETLKIFSLDGFRSQIKLRGHNHTLFYLTILKDYSIDDQCRQQIFK